MKKYSIVIPTYKQCSNLLKRCIDSIFKYTNMSNAEIIISAYECTEDTQEYIISLGNSVIIEWNAASCGKINAINSGILRSSGEYVVLLDHNSVLVEQPISEWLETMNSSFSNPAVGIAGPQLTTCDALGRAKCIQFSCAMIKRELINQIGLLDSSYFPNGVEDFDFCQRAMRSNYALYHTPDVKILHKETQDTNLNSTHNLYSLWKNEQYFRDKFGQIDDCLSDQNIQKNEKIKYSIVIPTYNHCDDLLKPCVDSILSYTDLSDTELVISANGCVDNTRDYLKSLATHFKDIGFENHLKVFWSDDPLGYSKATNEGIKISIGKYVVLLNNDTVLLPQERHSWLNILTRPFNMNPKCGVSSVVNTFSEPANHNFAIFFCVMVSRELFNKIGLLNEYYGKGAGEDTEFCVEAERAGYNVCQALDTEWSFEIGTNTGHFPIYHKGEGTVHDTVLVPDWSDVFLQNSLKLAKKYNIDWFREQLKTIPPTNLFWLECGSMSNQTDYKQTIINDRFRIKTENFNGREVVDVGAKRGIFSILSASKGASKVHAIEPLTKNYGELLQNIAFSKFSNVIFPVQKFGGSKSEHHLEFLKTKSNSDLTNLDEDYTSIGAISMTEIAQLVNSPNSVLKVDCDGCEYDLFLNASQADLKNFSYIVLEEYQDLNPNCQNYCVLEQRIFDLGFYMDYCTQALPHVQNFKEKMSNQVLPFKTTFWRRRETISE